MAQARRASGVTSQGAARVLPLAAVVEEHQRALSAKWTRMQGGEVLESPALTRYVTGLKVSFTNGVHAARLGPGDVDRHIADAKSAFDNAGVPALWWVGPLTRPGDLGARLELAGFRHEEDMPWLAAELASVAEAPTPRELLVKRVSDQRDQAEWVRVMKRGFGMTAEEEHAMNALATVVGYGADAEWIRFLGRVEGRPVATSGLMLGGGAAGLYNVTTVPEFRRRGYAAAMTAVALEEADRRGHDLAVLGSSQMAIGIYQRLGFREACRFAVYRWN